MIDKHKNPDGTYNGVTFMAELSGLSEEEILWTFNEVKRYKKEGIDKEVYLPLLKKEAKDKFRTNKTEKI